MKSLEGIDLQDSFVLDFFLTEDELCFHLEASIWPNSKFYSEPKDNEYTCYKKGLMKFKKFDSVHGLKDKAQVMQSSDASGAIDYGNIDSFEKTDNGFCVIGDFGSVSLVGGEVDFTIYT